MAAMDLVARWLREEEGTAESQTSTVPTLLKVDVGRRLLVGDVMTERPLSVAPETATERALDAASERGVNHLVVVASRELLGVLCICDLWWAAEGSRVVDLMSQPVLATEPAIALESACRKMELKDVGCLPVLRNHELVGIVTRGDLLRAGAAAGFSRLARVCLACGGHHHVRRVAAREHPVLCLQCIATREPHELERAMHSRR